MFYVKKLEHEIVLEPIHFGPKLKQTIIRLLKDEVEGISLATYGYVVNVIEVPEDEIRSVSSFVLGTFFNLQLFCGACAVCADTSTSLACRYDPNFRRTSFLPRPIPKGIIEYGTGNVVFYVSYTALLLRPFLNEVLDATVSQCNPLGFFAFVGPLRIFVSKHSMPEDMFNGFDGERDAWVSEDKEVVITSGCGVRLKIKGRTVEQGNITAIGTIKDNYLGLIDDGSGELAEQ